MRVRAALLSPAVGKLLVPGIESEPPPSFAVEAETVGCRDEVGSAVGGNRI
jgi:hypothetical protein